MDYSKNVRRSYFKVTTLLSHAKYLLPLKFICSKTSEIMTWASLEWEYYFTYCKKVNIIIVEKQLTLKRWLIEDLVV
jgi:hypothetical protein